MRLLLLVPLVLATACAFTDVRGHADVNNRSLHDIEMYVDGKSAGTIEARSIGRVTFDVPVPNRGNGTEPQDQSVPVKIAFKDLATGQTSPSAPCTAGAKIFTHVDYYTYGSADQYAQVSCDASYNRIPRDTLRAAQP